MFSPRHLLILSLCAIATVAVALPMWLWEGPAPTQAAGGETVGAVAAGGFHSCAVTTDGGLKCWGNNGDGRLGDGTTTNRTTPVDVCATGATAPCGTNVLADIVAVSAGNAHTCALTTGGGVKCWGSNQFGRLGDGTTTGRTTPVDVSGLTTGVAAIAAGHSHTCALLTTGGVKCWGYNFSGQLGDGTTTDRSTPVDVCADAACEASLGSVAAISAGFNHTCAVTTAGGVKCWGYNGSGELGDGGACGSTCTTPVDVCATFPCATSLSGIADISAANSYTCALTTGGGVKCWGSNSQGSLGHGGTLSNFAYPQDVCATGATFPRAPSPASLASRQATPIVVPSPRLPPVSGAGGGTPPASWVMGRPLSV
jgi:alpha-tubulin suppressor-like RCC1 family protein